MPVRFAAIALVVFSLGILRTLGAVSAENVVVVANLADPVSQEIARYYMERRGIPSTNLIQIEASTEEAITWDDFVDTLYNPLRRRLISDGWITGTITNKTDDEGRIAGAIIGHKMDFLVVCRLPLRLKKDDVRLAAARDKPVQKAFQVNTASVDSELSLLAVNGVPSIGFVPNPLYSQERPPQVVCESVVRVARLDGPSLEAVKRSIDSALDGERLGLRGRGYIDLGGPAKDGDRWLEQAGTFIEQLGYPVSWDREKAQFGWGHRFDGAAFYFGWYGNNQQSVIADRDFRFPPGAIAMHIHSYTAASVRSAHARWVGPLVDRGAAATMGNVYEPYLQMTHRPNLFMEGLTQGMTTGEAAYYALPVLSWMPVFVGDPLYRPFKRDLNSQFDEINRQPDELAQYVVLRQMKILRSRKQFEESFAYGVEAFKRTGGLALAYNLAKQYELRGGRVKAMQLIEPWLGAVDLPVDEWGLVFELGKHLESINEEEKALGIYQNLMRLAEGSFSPLSVYYPAAIEAAHELGLTDEANAMQATLTQMRVTEQEDKIREKMQQRQAP